MHCQPELTPANTEIKVWKPARRKRPIISLFTVLMLKNGKHKARQDMGNCAGGNQNAPTSKKKKKSPTLLTNLLSIKREAQEFELKVSGKEE